MVNSAGQREMDKQGQNLATAIAVAVVAPLVCTLGVLGGVGSFATVRHLAERWFGPSAWTVPVGIDLGIVALLAWDLLAEYLGLPWPVLRWTAWAFVTATTYLNIAAARGSMTAIVMHAAMPVLFVTVVEGIRHLIRQYVGLAAGTRIERIPLARWLLAPRSTFLLGRRMVLWHVTSYREGLALEYQRVQAIARLQRTYGRWVWRWRAPLDDRLALRLFPVVDTPADDGGPSMSPRDEKLIQAASAILGEASSHGQTISQAALGRQLRAAGHAIGNDRLRWLTARAQAQAAASEPLDSKAA